MATELLHGGNFTHNKVRRIEAAPIWSRFSLKGRTAIVSGAGASIGLAVAQAFAEMGANVMIWYNSSKVAHERAAEIEKRFGVKCKAYQVDIRNYEGVERAVNEQVLEFNGRLDIFVANAGIPWTKGEMIDGPLDHYRDVVATNLDGTYFCAKAAGNIWRRQKVESKDLNGKPLENFALGSFIATASMSGIIVNIPQLQSAYNTAKAAVFHLCKSLAVEWVSFARANSISPGYIITAISKFVPENTKNIWKDKIPLGVVKESLTSSKGCICTLRATSKLIQPAPILWLMVDTAWFNAARI